MSDLPAPRADVFEPPRLYVLRHGIAEDAHPDAPHDDGARRLTEKGRQRTERAAHGMKRLGVAPVRIASSPHTRARQTAEIVAGVLAPPEGIEVVDALGFGGSPAETLAYLQRDDLPWPLMIVGHQPMLSEVVGALVTPGVLRQRLRKAGLVGIDLHRVGARQVGELQMYLPPRVLRAVADGGGRHGE